MILALDIAFKEPVANVEPIAYLEPIEPPKAAELRVELIVDLELALGAKLKWTLNLNICC